MSAPASAAADSPRSSDRASAAGGEVNENFDVSAAEPAGAAAAPAVDADAPTGASGEPRLGGPPGPGRASAGGPAVRPGTGVSDDAPAEVPP